VEQLQQPPGNRQNQEAPGDTQGADKPIGNLVQKQQADQDASREPGNVKSGKP
jgi:hypothetical protein